MGILGTDDVEMDGKSVLSKKKNKKGVKGVTKNAAAVLVEKGKKLRKGANKPAVLSEKKKSMKETKVLKNQIWMKAVKEVADRTNLIPIHQELLAKIVGRTCLPQHKERFLTFVEHSLKINREKYGKSIEELFMMLKKNYKRLSQSAGLQKIAVAASKVKKEELEAKADFKADSKSNLTKSQRSRLRKKERQKIARARDGVLQPAKVNIKKKGVSQSVSKKSNNSKGGNKKEKTKKVKNHVKKEIHMEGAS